MPTNTEDKMVSTTFPGEDYIPFATGLVILDNLFDFTIKDVGEFIGCDCWGVAIANADGTIREAHYNGYVDDHHDKYMKLYRWALIEHPEIVIEKVQIGERLNIYMFGHNGYLITCTRVDATNWTYSFTHSPKMRYPEVHGDPDTDPITLMNDEGATIYTLDPTTITDIQGVHSSSTAPAYDLIVTTTTALLVFHLFTKDDKTWGMSADIITNDGSTPIKSSIANIYRVMKEISGSVWLTEIPIR